MKKIIYSLVIMIAAGSLFTSCIDQVEPVGILAIRNAKADYIRALQDLRAADAEFRRAEAQLKLADARYRDAETAWKNAQTENQKLLNEMQALLNEAQAMDNELKAAEIADKIARMLMQMEEDAKQHEIDMLKLDQALAQAQEDLRVALRNIALHSQDLTSDEKKAVAEAVALYEGVYEVYLKQAVKVKEQQAYVDSLKEWKRRFADQGWDSDNHKYAYKVDLWQREIERAEKRIENYKAKLDEVPSPDEIDMNEWNAELEAYEAMKNALTYEYNTTVVKEITEYYVTNVHDGVKAFNDAIKVHQKALEDATGYDGYKIAMNAVVVAGDASEGKFYKGNAAKIKFPTLPNDDISAPTFNKFAYLLKSYEKKSPADKEQNIMKPATDTIKILAANQAMKDFILGAKGNGEGSQVFKNAKGETLAVANYGLWGAYDILERELVTNIEKEKTEKEIADLKKAMNEADSVWAAHRQILIDGLAKFEPYTKAIKAYTDAVSESGSGAKKMVEAVKAIKEAFGHLEGGAQASFDFYDSTEVFKKILDFAKAREEYLDYKAPKAADIDPFDAAKRDSTVFYYSKGKSGAGKPILASKKFTALTWEELRAGEYEYDLTGAGDNKPYGTTEVNAFGNILLQLMGTSFVTAITADPIAAVSVTDDMASALYKTYTVNTWGDPKTIQKGGADYTPSNITAAKEAVLKAVDSFIDVYNSYWNQTVAKAGTEYDAYFTKVEADPTKTADIKKELEKAEKAINDLFNKDLDPKCYTLATFKPYADKAPIVTFSDGANVDGTDAINAILTAVDPACTDKTDNTYFETNPISTGAIFNGNKTDFYKFMKASYDYHVATNPNIKNELAAIEKWIKSVETAFENDAADAGKEDKEMENKYTIYKYLYEKDAAFYGIAVDSRYDVPKVGDKYVPFDMPNNCMYTVDITGSYSDPNSITPANKFELINFNVLGDADGWVETLGGELLALAEKLFPEFPAKWQSWKEAIEEYNDEKAHLDIVIDSFKAAYFAAAKAAGYDKFNDDGKAAVDWDELYEAYKTARKAYVETLKNKIKADTKVIDDNAKKIADFWSEIPAIDIEIAEAEADLKIQQHRLAALEKAIDLAKANMDKILEYVKSQDANFILPEMEGVGLSDILSILSAAGISIPGLI